MHVLAAFLIFIGLYTGFQTIREIPENELVITTDAAGRVKVRDTVTSIEAINKANIVRQEYDYSCGSAALATLLNYRFGEDFEERQVIQGLLRHGDSEKIARRRAFSLLDMKQFVGVLGYKGVGYKAAYEDLATMKRPCLLPIKIFEYRHFTVFRGIYKDHVILADPWRGNISLAKDAFLERWYQNVIFVVYPEGAKEIPLLALKEEDLRFIDEDTAMKILFDPALTVKPPVDRRIDDLPQVRQTYKR